MKLSKCTYGTIVRNTFDDARVGTRVGMIVGIANNCPHADSGIRAMVAHAVIEVQWSDGRTSTIHPAHIEPYKD